MGGEAGDGFEFSLSPKHRAACWVEGVQTRGEASYVEDPAVQNGRRVRVEELTCLSFFRLDIDGCRTLPDDAPIGRVQRDDGPIRKPGDEVPRRHHQAGVAGNAELNRALTLVGPVDLTAVAVHGDNRIVFAGQVEHTLTEERRLTNRSFSALDPADFTVWLKGVNAAVFSRQKDPPKLCVDGRR